MKIQLWSIGKGHEPYIKTGTDDFTRRIARYYPVEWKLIAPPRNAAALSIPDLKKKEGGDRPKRADKGRLAGRPG